METFFHLQFLRTTSIFIFPFSFYIITFSFSIFHLGWFLLFQAHKLMDDRLFIKSERYNTQDVSLQLKHMPNEVVISLYEKTNYMNRTNWKKYLL